MVSGRTQESDIMTAGGTKGAGTRVTNNSTDIDYSAYYQIGYRMGVNTAQVHPVLRYQELWNYVFKTYKLSIGRIEKDIRIVTESEKRESPLWIRQRKRYDAKVEGWYDGFHYQLMLNRMGGETAFSPSRRDHDVL